jgi:hypothetical protein
MNVVPHVRATYCIFAKYTNGNFLITQLFKSRIANFFPVFLANNTRRTWRWKTTFLIPEQNPNKHFF